MLRTISNDQQQKNITKGKVSVAWVRFQKASNQKIQKN